MAWDHLAINKPHLVYIILGGFTSLFMLCSSFIKERMYIGEATVATICGVIFGPHAANLIDPSTWGNVDQITLEFSRIVLVVQCFAVGVELPKYYMEKHWRSVALLLIPVMTVGWLVTSVFIFWLVPPLSWLQSLAAAACVTATDPVLASSVVGKGKFAQRVPKHLRDLLSAESGCNDGMAFPFIYLALYLIHYHNDAKNTTFNWLVITILYECVFGAIYGFAVGYIGRRGIRWAAEKDLVDRESFLVFYFVLALFCAGSGSILGVDDLLVGFAAGVGFSNDGWFTHKTEESHVSNVIDLLINLAYFVYFGTIIPWDQFYSEELGTTPWRLVVIALFVILFRRIPIMMALKPVIPDIKTWREALFAGHFGPIGVGAIFVAILARAELETGGATPLAVLPGPEEEEYHLIALIWPITCFLVIASIVVHGSSIAVFTLGKHINTLTISMSYTTANEDGPSWMNRLPRISSQSKSMSKMSDTTDQEDRRADDVEKGMLGMPSGFLRRLKEEDNPTKSGSRPSSLVAKRRKMKWDGYGPGGPISQSAIAPIRPSQSENTSATLTPENGGSPSNEDEKGLVPVQDDPEMHETLNGNEAPKTSPGPETEEIRGEREVYREGSHIIVENADGDVISVQKAPEDGIEDDTMDQADAAQKPSSEPISPALLNLRRRLGDWMHKDDVDPSERNAKEQEPERRKAAFAYQFGNTVILEDEDGEVVKKYDLSQKGKGVEGSKRRNSVTHRMGHWLGGHKEDGAADEGLSGAVRQTLKWSGLSGVIDDESDQLATGDTSKKPKKHAEDDDSDDDRLIRFKIGAVGRRMTKDDFLKEMQALDPKSRTDVISDSDASPAVKELAYRHPFSSSFRQLSSNKVFQLGAASKEARPSVSAPKQKGADFSVGADNDSDGEGRTGRSTATRPRSGTANSTSSHHLAKVESPSTQEPETAAERRRRLGALKGVESESSEPVKKPTVTDAETPAERRRREALGIGSSLTGRAAGGGGGSVSETPAERRRREAALGLGADEDSDEDDTPRVPPAAVTPAQKRGIRFAAEPAKGRN